jgi:type IV pilus assembly protein PilC
VNQFWLILLLIVTLVVGLIAYKNTKTWAEQLELFIFDLPLVWTIYRNYVLANISSSLSTLVGSGVSIIKTLTLTGKASNSIIYENIFEDLVNKVSKWEWITKSMEDLDKEHKFFPLDFLQMLSVWEKTANLESISKKISIQYEKEVDYSLARLTKWIEPLAILLAWIFVSWFAFAIFGAIMKVTDTIG